MQPISRWLSAVKYSDCPTVTLLIGLPGTGKSTWIRENRLASMVTISSDDILEAWGAETGLNYSEAFRQADLKNVERQMFTNLEAAVDAGSHIIVDRTNISRKVRAKIMNRIPDSFAKYAIVFVVAPDELKRRLDNRAATTGKYIPPNVIEDMLLRFEMPTNDEFKEVFSWPCTPPQ